MEFLKRLKLEQEELQLKLDKLNEFNNSGDKFEKLSDSMKSYLLIQAGAMYTYNECLLARLAELEA